MECAKALRTSAIHVGSPPCGAFYDGSDMKEAYYFPHDYNARQDPKLLEVLMELGCEGIGIYWCIIEQMYEQGGSLPLDSVKLISFSLHVKQETVKSLISDYGLFEQDDTTFWSPSARTRLKKREEVSAKRREAGAAGLASRWESKRVANATETMANATEVDSKVIANYSKENKIKRKEIESTTNQVNNISLSLENMSDAAVAERERILEIFYFEKNCVDYFGETQRFIAHYEADGWCRKGNDKPVKDRVALARSWKVETPVNRTDPTLLTWHRKIYDKVKAENPQAARSIIRDIVSIKYLQPKDGIEQIQIAAKNPAVAKIIDKALQIWPNDLRMPNTTIWYRTPKTKNE